MTKFAYTATNKEGKTVQGTADSTDRSSLVAALSKQGLRPVVIKLSGTNASKRGRAKKVKLKELK